MYRNIVVGYNGSDEGRDALAVAAHLRAADGRVTAVSVYSDPGPGRGAEWNATMRAAAAELLADVSVEGDWLETTTAPGHSAAHGLHEFAEQAEADLIVVGSSHRGAVGRILAGSVAKGLMNGAGCPVAVAPKGYREREGDSAKIGVAYDGSPESAAALQHAIALTRELEAELAILCVVAPIEAWTADGWYGTFTDKELESYREIEVRRMVDEASAPLAPDVRERLRVIDGRPADVLARESVDFDMLLMGSRGYGPVRRVLLGSTSAAVIEHASCPVLLVPRGSVEGSGAAEQGAAAEHASA